MTPYDQIRQDGKVRPYPLNLRTICKFWVNIAGRHRLPEKEIVKCFVNGLKPDNFREEMYSRTFNNLDDVIQAREELSTYRDILEISDRVKKSEPEKEFGIEKNESILRVWRLFR